MTLQARPTAAPAFGVPILPETAPFTAEQRFWLNGFFAGLLSLDGAPMSAAMPLADLTETTALPPPESASAALATAADADDAPWHDPAMPLAERLELAAGRPRRQRLFAAMAQQDCGQCGYLCRTYSEAINTGAEKRLNLCAPGGKETLRAIKATLAEDGVSPVPTPATGIGTVPATPAAGPAAAPPPGQSRANPLTAVFRGATCLCGAGSQKDTRHVIIDLPSCGIDYEPGDSLGVFPVNDPALVDAVLEAMRAPPDFPIAGQTFRNVLIQDMSLGPAPDMLFELLSHVAGSSRRAKLQALARGEDLDGDAATLDVLAVLEKFPLLRPDPEAFVEALEPLQPRLYSISSSPRATPGEVHLTIDTVRWEAGGRRRSGVASGWFADRLRPGDPIRVYVQKAQGFRLPQDPATPIVMVGPGTGVAPFRSFLWERRMRRATGKSWLFFGHQRESCDFFYRDEFESFLADGTLTTLSTAWSRDGVGKVYVQDRMREAGGELWQWLRRDAVLYVCGDAKRMARDVERAVIDITVEHGSVSAAGARDFVADLKAGGRYLQDVY